MRKLIKPTAEMRNWAIIKSENDPNVEFVVGAVYKHQTFGQGKIIRSGKILKRVGNIVETTNTVYTLVDGE